MLIQLTFAKNHGKYFCTLVFFLVALFSRAQLGTSLTIQSPPPPVLSEWATKNATLTFVVSKTDSSQQFVLFKTEIKSADGTVVCTTDLSKVVPVMLTRGTKVFFSKDVLPLEKMLFTTQYQNILNRTGKLPAGSYQLCIQLVSPGNFQPVVVPRCGSFNVIALQLPILTAPANNIFLDQQLAQTAITFRWTPLIPATQNMPTYRLQVFEVLPMHQATQALRSNQPILDVSLRSVTQYIWRPGLDFNAKDSVPAKLIWTIQTLDAQGYPVMQTEGNGEARSEPFIFYVTKKKEVLFKK